MTSRVSLVPDAMLPARTASLWSALVVGLGLALSPWSAVAQQSEETPSEAAESAPQSTAQATAAEVASEVAEPAQAPVSPEDSARARELLEEINALAREREALAESLRELDQRAQEAAQARAEEIRQQTERLREAQEELRESAREAERAAAREQAERQHGQRDDDDWVSRARRRDPNEKFGFGSTVKVRAREVVADVVVIAGGAKVDGDVYGDVTTFGGPAKINGRVSGSVTAFGNDVELGPRARVEGDVNCIGGEIREHPGSYVGGNRGGGGASFDMDAFDDFDRARVFGSVFGWADWVQFFWALIFTGFLILLASVVYLILQRPVERVRDAALNAPLRSLLTGFLVLVLSVPALVAVMVVLVISIIGIPFLVILCLLLPFALIGFIVATFYGYTAVALGVGGVLRNQFRLSWTSGLALLAMGIVALRAFGLSSDLLDAIGLPGFVTILFGFAGFVVQVAALSMAIGAVVTSKFGLASGPSSGVVPPPDLPPVPEFDDELDEELRIGVELADDELDDEFSDWMDEPSKRDE